MKTQDILKSLLFIVLTKFGAFRHITVLPTHGPICGETPRPIQTEPSWIAAKVAAVFNLFVNFTVEMLVFMEKLIIP